MNSIILIVLGVLLTMGQPARAVEVPSREWCKNQLAEQAAETPTELECIKRYGDKIAGTALQPKRGAIDCAAIEQQKRDLERCLKTDPNSIRCAELSDFDYDESEVAHCRAKPKPTRAAEEVWWTDCRHGWITKEFKGQDDLPVEIIDTSVRITYDELRKLMKDLPRITRALKACDAYQKCLDDRDAGKVKQCYANDRRWREYFTGGW
jgi:hypothetical protein